MKPFFIALTALLLLTGCSKTAILQNDEISRESIGEAYNSVRPIREVEVTLTSGEVVRGRVLRIGDDDLVIRGEVETTIPNDEVRKVEISGQHKPPGLLEPFVGILIFPVVVVFSIIYWMGGIPP